MNHHARYIALVQSLATITLAAGGVDDDTRAALTAASHHGAQARRDAGVAGQDALHLRQASVRAVREASREVEYLASSDALDSYDEVLRQNWILDRYRKNPVVLWSHNNDWAVPGLPVGRGNDVRVEQEGLLITVQFSEKNPFAMIVFDMVLEGMLRACSVGFRPHKVTRELVSGIERTVCDLNELYELSICPIGSNPDALDRLEGKMVAAIEASRSRAPAALQHAAKGKTMKIKRLSDSEQKDLRRRGILSHQCEECSAITVFKTPNVPKLAEDEEKALTRVIAAEDRAKVAETERASAETRLKAAESAASTAVAERDVAKKETTDAKARADKAVSEKAAVELAPLVGLEPWQLTPAQGKRLAVRAATDPDGYAADVEDTRAKGTAAGRLPASTEPRVKSTSMADPTPVVTAADLGDTSLPDPALDAEIKKRVHEATLRAGAEAIRPG